MNEKLLYDLADKWQAIIWVNDSFVHWRIHASFGPDALTFLNNNSSALKSEYTSGV